MFNLHQYPKWSDYEYMKNIRIRFYMDDELIDWKSFIILAYKW